MVTNKDKKKLTDTTENDILTEFSFHADKNKRKADPLECSRNGSKDCVTTYSALLDNGRCCLNKDKTVPVPSLQEIDSHTVPAISLKQALQDGY